MENSYTDMLEHFKNLQNQNAIQSNYWRRYEDTIKAMSSEQKAWVTKQESVQRAKQAMFSVFLDYIFDLNKDAFVSVADGKYKKVVDDYITTIQKSADSYISRAEQLEQENRELKNKLQEFMRNNQNESMAANGNRRGGKNNPAALVREGRNSEPTSVNYELFEDQSEFVHKEDGIENSAVHA